MATKDLVYGARTIRTILKGLDQPESLEHLYAEAVLAQAKINAAKRPTPQSRMAARNMVVKGSDIVPSAGGAPAQVAIGSEFGSAAYRQFQKPPNPKGYWLFPAANAIAVLSAGDEALESLLQKVING